MYMFMFLAGFFSGDAFWAEFNPAVAEEAPRPVLRRGSMGLTGTRQVSVEVGKASQPEVGDEEMDADSEHPGACL